MSLDALDVAGEVKVKVELVNVLVFVLLASRFSVALDRLLLLFFLQCCLSHRGLDGHEALLTPQEKESGTLLSLYQLKTRWSQHL